jgi:hypothetical protein
MAEEPEGASLDIQIANQFINVANGKMSHGVDPSTVAAALRNAAANFSAFAVAHEGGGGERIAAAADEFQRMLDFYADAHRVGRASLTPLERLVKQVKDE